MQPSLVIKQGTNAAQVSIPSNIVTVPMSVNSSNSGPIQNIMTLNKPVGQNVVVNTQNLNVGQPGLMPNVQILNMRAGAPQAQKSVATVSPRVVLGSPQVMAASRPQNSGITLQTLQSLQPGQQGHLLLKTENGQYQLLRVGPAPGSSTLAAPPTQPIRLTTAPAVPCAASETTSVAPAPPPAPMPVPMPVAMPASVGYASYSGSGAPLPPQAPPQPSTTLKPSDNTKEKCRNFLANLLDLSSKEPPSVEHNVRKLIQELIDAQVEPEKFCDRLERLLNASPQPCLIGFLKKSLPLLRQSMVTMELAIEGINPPPPHVVFPNYSQPLQLAGMPMKPLPKPGGTISVLQNIPVHTKFNTHKVTSGKGMNKANIPRGTPAAGLSTVLTPGKSLLKDKERKSAQFPTQPFSDDKMAGDDDINDVAAMGGVNLAEETQRILGSTEMIGTQIRSCKDEFLIPNHVMQARLKAVSARHGLDEPGPDVAALFSHALHERLKSIVEKLAVIAQHRIDLTAKSDDRYEITQDVKGQLKFLEELDRVEKKRREDSEREILMRAAKSRSKNEDPEQAKLKAKAKEMQRVEMEELRQREANVTALQAIGPRKKPRLELPPAAEAAALNVAGPSGRGQMPMRSRLKRVTQRDMMFLMEQDVHTAHSVLLYKSYLK